MAKDPAFLFYTNDFSTGTQFFSDEQVGKYLRLLMAQHQHGRLPENHMLFICKTYDKDIWSKFKRDEAGLFYNEKLETIVNERAKYAESRRNNRLGKTKEKNISESYDKHMEDEIEDSIIPIKDIFINYGLSLLNKNEDYRFSLDAKYDTWVADGWKDGHGEVIKNWKNKLRNTIPHLKPMKTPAPTKEWFTAMDTDTGEWFEQHKTTGERRAVQS